MTAAETGFPPVGSVSGGPGVAGAELDNGLRVRVAPVEGVSAVGIALHYGVGFRSDPEHVSGMAHLFEHLMFQGGLPGQDDHFSRVESIGGYCNASTRQDYTDFYSVVPSESAGDILSLEAERLREPSITAAGIRAQRDVVREEISGKSNRPYGRFPWPALHPLLFTSFANSHDGYGDPLALESADPAACLDFFQRNYTPSNAVLTISGDIGSQQAIDLAERHFGDLPDRPATVVPVSDEPVGPVAREGGITDPLATMPALALGYRTPDPASDPDAHFALALLSEVLTGGSDPVLGRRMRERHDCLTSFSARSGLFDFLDARDPEVCILTALYPGHLDRRAVLEVVDTELARLAEHGPSEAELERAHAARLVSFHRRVDQLAERTRMVGRGELLFGDGDFPNSIRDGLSRVNADAVAAAARSLTTPDRAVLSLSPGGAR